MLPMPASLSPESRRRRLGAPLLRWLQSVRVRFTLPVTDTSLASQARFRWRVPRQGLLPLTFAILWLPLLPRHLSSPSWAPLVLPLTGHPAETILCFRPSPLLCPAESSLSPSPPLFWFACMEGRHPWPRPRSPMALPWPAVVLLFPLPWVELRFPCRFAVPPWWPPLWALPSPR